MKQLTGLFLLLVTFAFATPVVAQFEGVIEFTKTIGTSVTTYKYYVKGNNVRIEELSTDGRITGIMLVDIKNDSIVALNPKRKLYMDVPNRRRIPEFEATVNKQKKKVSALDHNCSVYKVTCKAEDRIITYKIAENDFEFFAPLLKTLNRKDKQALYFQKIADLTGAFPMVGEERKLDGTLVSKLKVKKVTRASIDASLFSIASGYEKFQR